MQMTQHRTRTTKIMMLATNKIEIWQVKPKKRLRVRKETSDNSDTGDEGDNSNISSKKSSSNSSNTSTDTELARMPAKRVSNKKSRSTVGGTAITVGSLHPCIRKCKNKFNWREWVQTSQQSS